jgi:hypothetical protein
MEITTMPTCRVGWQGSTLNYVVKAKGASEVLVPENGMDGVEIRVVDTRQTADGVEARLAVKVVNSELY